MATNEQTKTGLLAGEVLRRQDAQRLILEGLEQIGARLDGLPRREVIILMRQVITWGVEALEKREYTKNFREVGWESIEARAHCRAATRRDLRYCLRKMLKQEGVGELPLRSMSTVDCRRILQEAFGHSSSLYIKGRAVLSSIFSYGVKQELCDSNPVSRIDVPKIHEAKKAPLSPQDVERLKATAEQPEHRAMRFSLHLMLYGGVRPTEVSRLQKNDINWETRQLIIRPATSKTGGGRVIPLRKMEEWQPEDCCIPRNWKKRWRKLREDAGFTSWVPDACRHTFASYHAAYYRNLPDLQFEMGHRDLSLLRSRYLMPVLKKDAERFWHLHT